MKKVNWKILLVKKINREYEWKLVPTGHIGVSISVKPLESSRTFLTEDEARDDARRVKNILEMCDE